MLKYFFLFLNIIFIYFFQIYIFIYYYKFNNYENVIQIVVSSRFGWTFSVRRPFDAELGRTLQRKSVVGYQALNFDDHQFKS
jgi:hypothetical protein